MNRFRDRTLRKEYDAAMLCFQIKHRDLFRTDGSRNLGSTFASYFWRGFDGQEGRGLTNFEDAAARRTLAYAYWRAGQDAARIKEQSLAAYTRCSQWLADGNEAKERGDKKRAEYCYEKSQVWLDRYNTLIGNG